MEVKRILITGGCGFLGYAIASYYRKKNRKNKIFGLGHSTLNNRALSNIYDVWVEGSVDENNLNTIREPLDLIIHCAGVGSVGYAELNPGISFGKTVNATVELLEYIRKFQPNSYLVYPSSPSVYGETPDNRISEGSNRNPKSIYGTHKKICEDLVRKYSDIYNLRAAVIRYYSIYGPGLEKQLLWDAMQKIYNLKNNQAIFWGSGNETRDWIFIDDAVELLDNLYLLNKKFIIVNGGTGIRLTIREILEELKSITINSVELFFNGEGRPGDPMYYQADMTLLYSLASWRPKIGIKDGLSRYKKWYLESGK